MSHGVVFEVDGTLVESVDCEHSESSTKLPQSEPFLAVRLYPRGPDEDQSWS